MKSTGQCPKCESQELLRIPGELQSKIGIPTGVLSWAPVTRYVCSQCGYLESFVEGPGTLKDLAEAYGKK